MHSIISNVALSCMVYILPFMIGHAKESGELYYLEKNGGNDNSSSKGCLLNKSNIFLLHKRLGHPLFSTIKRCFPLLISINCPFMVKLVKWLNITELLFDH